MARGTPCMITDVGAAGESGIIVPPGSPEQLADGSDGMTRRNRPTIPPHPRRDPIYIRSTYLDHGIDRQRAARCRFVMLSAGPGEV